MTKYVDREVYRYILPLSANVVTAPPRHVVLDFNTSDSVDFGALCYLDRSPIRQAYKGRRAYLDSFSTEREAQIEKLIALTRTQFTDAAHRPKTLYGYYRQTVKFIDWCDINGHTAVLSAPLLAQSAIKAWVIDARRRISGGQVPHNTAEQMQRAFPILKDYFADYDLTAGINLLKNRHDLTQPPPVPTDDAVGANVAFATYVLDGVYDLIINNCPFPYPLKMPNFLSWQNDTLWLFPMQMWAISSEQIALGPNGCPQRMNRAIDYQTGKIRSVTEVAPTLSNTSEEIVQNILDKLKSANSDTHHFHRKSRGLWGMQAFFVIFLAATGMNLSQATALNWSEELDDLILEGPQTRQNFRAIKYRAGGKEVVFQISAKYIPHLKRFLALRKHILNGTKFDFLFFGLPECSSPHTARNEIGLRAAGDTYEQNFFDIARRLTSMLPRVTPKMFRSAKDNHLIRTETPATTALIMQRSLKTTTQKYATGTADDVANEMGAYLAEVENKILNEGAMPSGGEPRSLGVCALPNEPKPIAANVPAHPDCKRSEGCLFCQNYRVHADEVDVRKLLSCHLVLRKTARFASNAEEHNAVFGHILRRIDFVLGAIVRHKPDMANTITSVRKEVDKEGLLHPYWAAKIEFLTELIEL
jgi:hypothetical protein